MIFRFKLASGVAQSFLFFSQVTFITNQLPSLRPLSNTTYTFTRLHAFILGFVNVCYFYLDELSFCLWNTAIPPQLFIFFFLSILFSIAFLMLFVAIVHYKSQSTGISCSCLKRIIPRMNPIHNSLVHGLTAFFVLFYSQYTFLSFLCLSKYQVYGKGGTTERSVAFAQGDMEYFGPNHLPYAIPALLILVMFSLPPPLLLISYPLLWQVRAKLRFSAKDRNEKTFWVIRKLLPFIDSFQGPFRDNCRYFAGLFFIWRLILCTVFVFSTTNLNEAYFRIEVTFLIIFTVHTLVRPYKRRLHNIIDGALLANMAIINLLKWYISVPITNDLTSQELEFLIFLQLLLMYLPLLFFWHMPCSGF